MTGRQLSGKGRLAKFCISREKRVSQDVVVFGHVDASSAELRKFYDRRLKDRPMAHYKLRDRSEQ
jgi:hypothetical protein